MKQILLELKTARRPLALSIGDLNIKIGHDPGNRILRQQRDSVNFKVSKIDSFITRLQSVLALDKRQQIEKEAVGLLEGL